MKASLRREKHREELRQIILDAAREIFVRDGYENFSMRKLARRIEYSPGSIYLHFKNREELFESLVEESFARLLKALTVLNNCNPDEDPVAVLRKGFRIYVDFGLRNVNDYRFAFMIGRSAPKRPYRVHPAFEVLRQMVRRCVTEKRFRAVDVETVSQALWVSAHGVTSLLIQRPRFPWVGKKQLIEQVIDGAVNSLLAPSDPAQHIEAGVRHEHFTRV